MRYAVLEELGAADLETLPAIQVGDVSLRMQNDGFAGDDGQRLRDEHRSEALPPVAVSRTDPTDACVIGFARDPQVRERKIVAQPQVPCRFVEVEAIEVGVCAFLLHDEDIAAQLQQAVKGAPVEIGKTGHVRRVHVDNHNTKSAVTIVRSIICGAATFILLAWVVSMPTKECNHYGSCSLAVAA